VVGNNQQIDRAAPGIVVRRQQARIDVAVRADQGQGADVAVECMRDLPLRGVGRKITIVVSLDRKRCCSFLSSFVDSIRQSKQLVNHDHLAYLHRSVGRDTAKLFLGTGLA
jgi:hypothetical protein